MKSAPRILSFSTLMIAVLFSCLAGCGGGGGGNTVTAPVINGGGAAPAPTAAVYKTTMQVLAPAGTPGSAPIADAPETLFERVASLFVSTVHAGVTLSTLPGYMVTAINGAGMAVSTQIVDNLGNATFTNLPAGDYLFRVSDPRFPSTVLLAVIYVPENQNVNGVIGSSSTAAAMIGLTASGGVINGMDIGAFTNQVNSGSNATTNAVLAAVQSNLAAGQPVINASGPVTSWTIPDATLQSNTQQASQVLFTIASRYPDMYQTGVARSNLPLYVAFNRAANVATLPPTNTGWVVRHTSASTGVSVTINSANQSAYGSWSYSDSAQTIAGRSIPAHALVFTYTGTMAANTVEAFQWSFGSFPQASDGTTLTTTLGSPGAVLELTFTTGSN